MDVHNDFLLNTKLGGWSANQTIATESYGTLAGRYYQGLKLAIIQWIGNNNQASAGTHSYILPSNFTPPNNYVVSLKPNGHMEVRTDGTITVTLNTATNWSAGTIVYPLA